VVNGSTYGRYYATDAYKIIYGNNFNHGLNRYELKRYDGTRLNTAFNTSIEYKPNDNFKIGTHLLYSYMTDDKYQKKQSYNWYDGSGSRIRLQNIHGKLNRQLYGGDIYTEFNLTSKLKVKARAAMYDNSFQYGNVPNKSKDDPRNGYYVMEFISPLLQFKDLSQVDQAGNAYYTNDPYDPNIFPVKLIGEDEPYGQGDDPYNIQPKYTQIFANKPVTAKDFEYYQSYTEINKTRERDAGVFQLDGEYKLTNALKVQVGSKYRNKIGSRYISKHEWFKDYSIPGGNQPFLLTDFVTENFSSTPGGFLKELGANYQDVLFLSLNNDMLRLFF
jgi:hypothetical protein